MAVNPAMTAAGLLGLPSVTAGGAIAPTGGSAGPSSAGSGVISITPAFDASAWTVATGQAKAMATNATGGSAANAIPWTYVGIAALVGLLLWKKL